MRRAVVSTGVRVLSPGYRRDDARESGSIRRKQPSARRDRMKRHNHVLALTHTAKGDESLAVLRWFDRVCLFEFAGRLRQLAH